jgi:hypothetical protein
MEYADSEILNRLWRNKEITPEEMKGQLLKHPYLRQYEVERLATICGRNARQTIRELEPSLMKARKYGYQIEDVRNYLKI